MAQHFPSEDDSSSNGRQIPCHGNRSFITIATESR